MRPRRLLSLFDLLVLVSMFTLLGPHEASGRCAVVAAPPRGESRALLQREESARREAARLLDARARSGGIVLDVGGAEAVAARGAVRTAAPPAGVLAERPLPGEDRRALRPLPPRWL